MRLVYPVPRSSRKDANSVSYLLGVLFLISVLALGACSSKNGFFGSNKNHGVKSTGLLRIPITVSYKQPATLNLAENPSLELVATATNLQVIIDGCASGYTVGATAIPAGVVNLYKFDRNCLVKLERFTFGAQVYTSTGTNTVPFTDWKTPGDYATFRGASDTDLIKVFVNTQVTQTGGVQPTDTISYNFTDIASTTTQNIGDASVSTGVPLSATGKDAPNFTITQARFLSTNANGSANVSFTLQCGSALTGTTLSTYACSTDVLQSQIDYIFIQDTYSQGAISVAAATAAFGANTATAVGSNIITLGGSDSYNNLLTNGGFYTSDSSPLVTGPSFYSNLNNVLIIRRKDLSGNVMSYKYFYVNFTGISPLNTVSACGTTFAGGAGTANNPYLVSTRDNIAKVANSGCNSNTVYFSQIRDIDFGGSATPWVVNLSLYGQYEGNGRSITGMYINGLSGNYSGLFSRIENGARVSNLNISGTVSLSTSSDMYVGLLAGWVRETASVSNVSTSGSISATLNSNVTVSIGGLIGLLGNSTATSPAVSSSSSSATIDVTGTYGGGPGARMWVGGLVGFALTGVLTSTYSTGNMTFNALTSSTYPLAIGGLIGETNNKSTLNVQNSYSTRNITLSNSSTAGYFVGGLVGEQDQDGQGTNISGCFSVGTIALSNTSSSSNTSVGGLVGYMVSLSSTTPPSIINSYTMVTTTASSLTGSTAYIGGFIGGYQAAGNGATTKSYSASPSLPTSGATVHGFVGGIFTYPDTTHFTGNYLYDNASVPSDTSTGIISYTLSSEMETQSNFSSFDFTTPVWKMPTSNALSPNGLLSPVLVWQCGKNGIVCP